MRLTLWFRAIPFHRGLEGSDNGLTSGMDMNVFDHNLLLALGYGAESRSRGRGSCPPGEYARLLLRLPVVEDVSAF